MGTLLLATAISATTTAAVKAKRNLKEARRATDNRAEKIRKSPARREKFVDFDAITFKK